jgi:hypothetical protein
MGVPSFFQMLWGGPKLEIKFSDFWNGDGKRFTCEISNKPVGNEILKLLGVRREQTAIAAYFRISESGTNRILLDLTRAPLIDAHKSGDGLMRAILEVQDPVIFICAIHFIDGVAHAVDTIRGTDVILPVGRYRVDVNISAHHRRVNASKEISIGNNAQQSGWAA